MSVSPYRGGQGGHYNTMASVSSNKSRRGQGHSQGTKMGQFLLMTGQILQVTTTIDSKYNQKCLIC